MATKQDRENVIIGCHLGLGRSEHAAQASASLWKVALASLTFRTLACVGSGELWRLVFAF